MYSAPAGACSQIIGEVQGKGKNRFSWSGGRGKEMAIPRGTDHARVIQVIETEALRGEGTESDPSRIVKQYWDFEGKLLAEDDQCRRTKE